MLRHQTLARLEDYQVSPFLIPHITLYIDLSENPVVTRSNLTIRRNPASTESTNIIKLDGQNISLESLKVNGNAVAPENYVLTAESLTIKSLPNDATFTIECVSKLGVNTDNFGLYESDGIMLAKAETQGMRRILFCLDRPDVLSTYTVHLIAYQDDFPVLLSNGNKIYDRSWIETKHSKPRHEVVWYDPIPKPTYLFAMVAGNLLKTENSFNTQSGRPLPVEFFIPQSAIMKYRFGRDVLINALKFDQSTYGLECAREHYMVACVDKYASGASETAGLNLFNSQNLLASPASSTDKDFLRVADVVSHEVFHDQTGNTVTVRDWHNLTLKEGLTTFRASQFNENYFGKTLIRILKGKVLIEEAPRPNEYTAVRSLYNSAAYEKSGEIFGMLLTVLGEKVFNAGIKSYVDTFKGGAVTIEDFLKHLSDFSGQDVNKYLIWFTQPGLVEVEVTDEYDPETQRYHLTFRQTCNKDSVPRPIPIRFGLLDSNGGSVIADELLLLEQTEKTLRIDSNVTRPIPSLLREFSAPVKIKYNYTIDNLIILLRHDPNLYNRHDAARRLITLLVKQYCETKTLAIRDDMIEAYRFLLKDRSYNLTPWVLAEIINLPTEEDLASSIGSAQIENIQHARTLIMQTLAESLSDELKARMREMDSIPAERQPLFSEFDFSQANARALKYKCMEYLSSIEPAYCEQAALEQFNTALGVQMNDTITALMLLTNMGSSQVENCLSRFYDKWNSDSNAINQWFRLQAMAHTDNVVNTVKGLLEHPAFMNYTSPNKIYSLLMPFTRNLYGMHAASGEGYQLMADIIIKLDGTNPPVAAVLAESMNNWTQYDSKRQVMMYAQLERIDSLAQSADVKGIVKKGLEKGKPLSPFAASPTNLMARKKDAGKHSVTLAGPEISQLKK